MVSEMYERGDVLDLVVLFLVLVFVYELSRMPWRALWQALWRAWAIREPNTEGLAPTDVTSTNSTLDEGKLYCELETVTEWHELGMYLGVRLYELDRIEKECSTNTRRLQRTLRLWLQRAQNASWVDVVSALQRMRQNRVAESIIQKYIREGSKFRNGPKEP